MKKVLFLFILISFVFSFMAVAAENDFSGFVGTWGGVFATPVHPTVKIAVVMKIDIDSEGKIFFSSYEYNGNVESPPKVVTQEPGLLTFKTKAGWTTSLTLETKDLIRARSDKSGNPSFTATFTRK
jgi:hypothetical protein